MSIELLYFDGCPSYELFVPRLRDLVAEAGIDSEVELRPVDSPEAAINERFLGSPTLRIGGVDVEPGADERNDFGLKCRLYSTAKGLRGTPPEEWVAEALDRARRTADGNGNLA